MKKYFSFIIFIGLFLFLGFYLDKNLNLIKSTFDLTINHFSRYFLIAFFSVLISMFFSIKSYQLIFRMNGISKGFWKLLKLNLAGTAVNVIIPTAGLSMAVIYVEEARKKRESVHTTVNSVIMTYISDYTSICLFLVFSLVYIFATDKFIMPHVWIPALVFILITLVVYFLAFFAGKESKWLETLIKKLAAWIEYPLSKLLNRKDFLKKGVDNLYHEFKEINKSIISDPKDWFLVLILAVFKHVFLILSLYIILASLGADPLIRVAIAGYSVGAALLVVSPTPQGIGFVEGGMYLIFTTLGVPAPIATSTIILYRSITFWLPLAFGFFFYQRGKLKEILT